MAQIVKSENGYWVGKELYPGETYISSDPVRYFHPREKFSRPTFDEVRLDISNLFTVEISENTPDEVKRKLFTELCNSKFGMLYVLDHKSPFGIQRVIDPPVSSEQ